MTGELNILGNFSYVGSVVVSILYISSEPLTDTYMKLCS